MPWFNVREQHAPNPDKATIQDVYGAVRVALNHAGGMVNTLAAIVLTQTRQDARLESIAGDLAAMRRKLVGEQGPDSDDE